MEVEVVHADIPSLDPPPDLIPAAETLTFPAYVSTALSTLRFGPSFSVESSFAAAAPAVAFCACGHTCLRPLICPHSSSRNSYFSSIRFYCIINSSFWTFFCSSILICSSSSCCSILCSLLGGSCTHSFFTVSLLFQAPQAFCWWVC